jgi:hypothetical protein
LRLVLAAAAVVLPARADAQSCAARAGLGVFASVARVQQQREAGAQSWQAGARVEWSANKRWGSELAYRFDQTPSATLHTAGLGGTARLPFAGTPCLTMNVFASFGTSLGPDDVYRNLTAPIGIVFVRQGRISPFAGAQVIYSLTSARLFSFAMSDYALGYGAQVGARIHGNRIATELSASATTVPAALGPQPLGRFRVDLSFGLHRF